MSCHPEFKCNLEIASKGEREKKGVFQSRRGAMLSYRVEIFVIPLRYFLDLTKIAPSHDKALVFDKPC